MDAAPQLDEVIALELRLLDPEARRNPDELERLLHEDFITFGASGRLWDRATTIASLAAEPDLGVVVNDLVARRVAKGVVLVTYLATRGAATGTGSLRSSLWVRSGTDGGCSFIRGRPPARLTSTADTAH